MRFPILSPSYAASGPSLGSALPPTSGAAGTFARRYGRSRSFPIVAVILGYDLSAEAGPVLSGGVSMIGLLPHSRPPLTRHSTRAEARPHRSFHPASWFPLQGESRFHFPIRDVKPNLFDSFVTQVDLAIILSQPWVERYPRERRPSTRSCLRLPGFDLASVRRRRSATFSPPDFLSLQLSPG
jgi:hypothetical protein